MFFHYLSRFLLFALKVTSLFLALKIASEQAFSSIVADNLIHVASFCSSFSQPLIAGLGGFTSNSTDASCLTNSTCSLRGISALPDDAGLRAVIPVRLWAFA